MNDKTFYFAILAVVTIVSLIVAGARNRDRDSDRRNRTKR